MKKIIELIGVIEKDYFSCSTKDWVIRNKIKGKELDVQLTDELFREIQGKKVKIIIEFDLKKGEKIETNLKSASK